MLERSPWEEWYDVDKLLAVFELAKFALVLYKEFRSAGFYWFNLVHRGGGQS